LINKEGIGLGLYITKKMAEGLGGNITVKSLEAHYTKFTLSLPVKQYYIKFGTEE